MANTDHAPTAAVRAAKSHTDGNTRASAEDDFISYLRWLRRKLKNEAVGGTNYANFVEALIEDIEDGEYMDEAHQY